MVIVVGVVVVLVRGDICVGILACSGEIGVTGLRSGGDSHGVELSSAVGNMSVEVVIMG